MLKDYLNILISKATFNSSEYLMLVSIKNYLEEK